MRDRHIRLITLLFFFSGAGALIYQVVWQRVLTQAIGVDHIAIVFIVTIFMMGLGLGSYLGGLATMLSTRVIMVAYAALEFSVGFFGIYSNSLLRQLNDWNAQIASNSIIRDFVINCALLLLPITLMGMTTPMLIHLLKDQTTNFGKTIGKYYGANIVGAAFGAICSLFLIELFGLFHSILFAVTINFIIGLVFLALAVPRRSAAKQAAAAVTPDQVYSTEQNDNTLTRIYLAAFLFGAANLAIQIVVFRIFINYFRPFSYLFPIGIAAYLVLMALGQSFGGRWIDSVKREDYPRVMLCLLAGTAGAFIIILNIPVAAIDYLNAPFPIWHFGFMLLTAFPLALLFMSPTFFASAFLPVMSKAALVDMKFAGRTFGSVLALSTIGNIVGAFFVGIFLLQWIGAMLSVTVIIGAIATGVILIGLGYPNRAEVKFSRFD